jgi:hypothetical protein
MSEVTILFILDQANRLALINSYILWTYLLLYFVRLLYDHTRREQSDQMVISKDVSRHAVALAFAMWFRETGTLVTRHFITAWRSGTGGHGGEASIGQAVGLTAGALILVVGSILIFRVLSRPLYGNRLWILATIASILYAAITAAW